MDALAIEKKLTIAIMRFRKLRIAFSATCGIACVLLIVLWVRSYRWADCMYWNIVGHRSALVASTHGRLVAYTDLFEIDPWKARFRLLARDEIGMSVVYPLASGIPSRSLGGMPGANSHYVVFSHWLIVVVTGTAGIFGIRRHYQFRFSLRTLLIATTLVAVVLGIIVYATRQ